MGEKTKIKFSELLKHKLEERKYRMKVSMILYISWKNLKMGKMRSLLTIGGVALGIGIITLLLCLGFGVQEMIVNEVTKSNPRNVVDINNGNLDNFVALNDEMKQKIMGIEGVTGIEVKMNTGGKVTLGDSQADVVFFGANKQFLEAARIEYRRGENSYENNESRTIISERLARLLGFENPVDALGKKILYDVVISKEVSSTISEETIKEGNEVEIVGIVERVEDPYMYVPFDLLHDNFGIDFAQSGKVIFENSELSDNIQQQLQQLGFIAESVNALIKDINSFFNTIRILLVIFGVIIMSISVMGMLNTLSVSLLQRTKEIGILKTLGAKRADIFKMFVLESVIISFLGGIFGFIFGYGMAFILNYGLILLGKRAGVELSFFIYVPVSFTMAIMSFIIFLGLVTGMMPAYRASRIHSLEALRYE
jgi:putative ABC transport system permease protein